MNKVGMNKVFVLVTVEEYDEGENYEPAVRVFGDAESARAASRDAMAANDYVALEIREVER